MTLTDLTPEQLSADLREGASKFLTNRRGILGLSLFSAGVMGGIGLYQMGVFKKIPEPPLPRLNAEKVNGSAEAYSHLATPDALLGLTSYGITACLAGAGGQNRWKTHPWIALGMAAKTILDAAMAGKLSVDQWTKYRALCFWCLLTSGATLAVLPLALPEARAALRQATR